MAATRKTETPAVRLLRSLKAGELALIAARPAQGKTLLGLQVLVETVRRGGQGAFFTLEYTMGEARQRLAALAGDATDIGRHLLLDCSDAIDADHIMVKLADMPPGAVAIIDYLQLLDQRREKPPLAAQVSALRDFARRRGLILIFLSQVDRSFDAEIKALPDAGDLRLPNPLNLDVFDGMCFLHAGAFAIRRSMHRIGTEDRS